MRGVLKRCTAMMSGLVALTVAAIFTGAAVYVNVAEQPARLSLEDRALLSQWKPSYKRGAAMQGSLALIGCVLGLAAWWQTSHTGFLIGAIAMVAPWPWTLLAIKPTNDALLATGPTRPGRGRGRWSKNGACCTRCARRSARWRRSPICGPA
jgi:hypothetical protein